ncbi:MAG TPA: hypothetical protein VFJ75_11580 [Gaiellaceae bacterium]|nr:hypothetical protein [Gaiellaceae bacterium]
MLTTPGDEPADWLDARQAARADPCCGRGQGVPQLVLRLGYPTSTPAATPRRDVADVLS